MWANAERDGRPAEYRWRPLLNAADVEEQANDCYSEYKHGPLYTHQQHRVNALAWCVPVYVSC